MSAGNESLCRRPTVLLAVRSQRARQRAFEQLVAPGLWTVVCGSTAEEALGLLRSRAFDVAVMDDQMLSDRDGDLREQLLLERARCGTAVIRVCRGDKRSRNTRTASFGSVAHTCRCEHVAKRVSDEIATAAAMRRLEARADHFRLQVEAILQRATLASREPAMHV